MTRTADFTTPPAAADSPVVKVTLKDRRFSDDLTVAISSPAERSGWVNVSFLAEGEDGHVQALWQLLRVFFSSEAGRLDGQLIQDLHARELELRRATRELDRLGSGPARDELVRHYAQDSENAGRRYAAMRWLADHVSDEAPRATDSVSGHPLDGMVFPIVFDDQEPTMLSLIQAAVYAIPGHHSSMHRLPVFRSR